MPSHADPSPSTAELAYDSVEGLRSRLDGGEIKAVELAENLLRRIEQIDSPRSPTALGSVLAVSERALDEAAESDGRRAAEETRGPLEGIPVLIKDSIEAVGLPGSAGATALAGRPPVSDAPLVSRMRAAGMVILGSTNLSEWANIRSSRSSGGWSAIGGLTGNPWALDRNPGGSSSGSGAAVAAGLAPLAVGTETDGSITCPASLNGVAGIKPTVGAVPTSGVVPISFSQDSAGPFGRKAIDVAELFEVLTGKGGALSAVSRGVAGLKIAVAETWQTAHPATDDLCSKAAENLRSAGAEIVNVSPALPGGQEREDEVTVLLCELKDCLDRYMPTRGAGPQSLAEVIAHEDAEREVELRWFGHDLFEKAMELGGCGNDRYREARARNLAWALGACLEPALAGVDVLIAPTYGPAWKSDLVLGGHPAAAAPTTMAPAIAGWPIATVPMGLAEGLPVGLGIIGRPGSEAQLLAVGAAVERPARPRWEKPRRG